MAKSLDLFEAGGKDYQKFFKEKLKATGKSIPDMDDDEKAQFFDEIDAEWDAKNESSSGKSSLKKKSRISVKDLKKGMKVTDRFDNLLTVLRVVGNQVHVYEDKLNSYHCSNLRYKGNVIDPEVD